MEFKMSSARLHVLIFIVCCLWWTVYSYPTSCVTSTPKDIVLLIADSRESGYHGNHGLTISPGLFYFIQSFIDNCDFTNDRLAIVTYSDTVDYVSPFSNNANDLHLALQKWRPEFGGVNTALALRSVQYYLKLNARHHAAQVVVVVTPEHSNNYYDTVSQSQQLRYHHVDIIGVGYGHYRPTKELVAMIEMNRQVFLTPTANHLIHVVPHLKDAICLLALQKTSTTPKSTTTTGTITTTTTTEPTTTTTEATTTATTEATTATEATTDGTTATTEATTATTEATTATTEATTTLPLTTTDDDDDEDDD